MKSVVGKLILWTWVLFVSLVAAILVLGTCASLIYITIHTFPWSAVVILSWICLALLLGERWERWQGRKGR